MIQDFLHQIVVYNVGVLPTRVLPATNIIWQILFIGPVWCLYSVGYESVFARDKPGVPCDPM